MPLIHSVRRRRVNVVLAVMAALASAGLIDAAIDVAEAQQPNRSAQLIKYRQALYTVMGRDFSYLGGMARDRVPFDAAEALKRASRVEVMVDILPEAFPEESKDGNTKAKPEIWTSKADFDGLLQELQTRSAALTAAARTGEEAATKAAIRSMGEVCGQCHDKYKSK